MECWTNFHAVTEGGGGGGGEESHAPLRQRYVMRTRI